MKKIIIVLFTMFVFLQAAFAEAKYTIKFSSVAPDGSTWMNVMQDFSQEVATKTNGDVKFKFYAGGVSGDEKDVIRKMKINEINAAGFTSQGLGEIVKEVRLLNLPLIFKNYNDIDYVMGKMSPFFEKEFEKKGFTVLGWPEVGFVYVYSKYKIESIDDFRKIKMWIWGDDILVNTLFKNIGIVPIPLSLVDVMQSLQTGLIEGVYCSPLSCIALQWNTNVKYMLGMKIANVPGGILINTKTWKALPEAYRKIILESGKKYFAKLTEDSRKENEEAIIVLKKKGMTVTEISSAKDLKTFEDVSIKTGNDLVGKFYTQAQLDEMLKYLAEVRAKSPANKK
jgi:TRAP-type C4-dicarboxylate transport system substrate-binding protein